MKFTSFTPEAFRRRVLSQIWMLGIQFILGMLLNFIGEDATGTAHSIYTIVLVLHILNAIGLVEGSVYIALKERSKLSWRAAGAFSGTLVAGVLTVLTHQDVWSFLMACGFLAASWLTGMQFLSAERQLWQTEKRTVDKKVKTKQRKR